MYWGGIPEGRKSMDRLNGRRLAITSLIGYATLAGTLTLVPISLPIAKYHLPYVFALEAVILAAGGLYIWHCAHRFIAEMAYRDELTRLGNRRAFNERTEQFGGSVGLILFDVDALKSLNEACGHQAGDELLTLVGRRLSGVNGDAYRIGGDEFAVVIDRHAGQSALPVLRLLEPFDASFASCGHSHQVRLSFGFASALSDETFPQLFSRADQRLRELKRDLYSNGALPNRRQLEAEAAEMDELLPAVGGTPKRGRSRLRLLR